jgi:hypothetical protein
MRGERGGPASGLGQPPEPGCGGAPRQPVGGLSGPPGMGPSPAAAAVRVQPGRWRGRRSPAPSHGRQCEGGAGAGGGHPGGASAAAVRGWAGADRRREAVKVRVPVVSGGDPPPLPSTHSHACAFSPSLLPPSTVCPTLAPNTCTCCEWWTELRCGIWRRRRDGGNAWSPVWPSGQRHLCTGERPAAWGAVALRVGWSLFGRIAACSAPGLMACWLEWGAVRGQVHWGLAPAVQQRGDRHHGPAGPVSARVHLVVQRWGPRHPCRQAGVRRTGVWACGGGRGLPCI